MFPGLHRCPGALMSTMEVSLSGQKGRRGCLALLGEVRLAGDGCGSVLFIRALRPKTVTTAGRRSIRRTYVLYPSSL